MAYNFPNMGRAGAQFPQPNYMPQMNQPHFPGYPPAQQQGNPYMPQIPQFPGGQPPMGFAGSRRSPANRQQVPFNPYGQGMGNMPFQAQPQSRPGGRRPGLISRLGANQQAGFGVNPAGMQFPQATMQQPNRRGLNLGRGRQGMGGGMPQMPSMPQMPAMPPMQSTGMSQPMAQQPMLQQPMLQQPNMVQANVSPMGKQIKPKQFNLNGIGGMSGTGIASIPDGNNLSLVANNLPDPAAFSPGHTYVAYLTNRKGQGSFALGPLMAIGAGTYKLDFNSNVPFYDYDQVLVSLENPLAIQNRPAGQVVLASAGGAGLSLPKPVRSFFGGVWQKVKGAGQGIGQRIGGGKTPPQTQLPETPNPQNLFNNYTLGPNISPVLNATPELPGLGSPTEAPPLGGESLK